jgi:hypothetical protein
VIPHTARDVVYAIYGRADSTSYDDDPASRGTPNVQIFKLNPIAPAVDRTLELTRCFLRLANLPNFPLDRLNRYEAALWRQACQILFALMRWIAANHRSESARSNLCSSRVNKQR